MHLQRAHKDKVAAKFARRVPKLAERLTIAGVGNAGRVSDSLYRGAQPRGQGYEELKRPGIMIVVDLRNSKPLTRETSETREQLKVEATGMRYVEIPTSAFLGPTDFQVATFLRLLPAHPNDKIFVHCYFGDDRTGVMIATYRMADEHWTSEQAYNEMRAFSLSQAPTTDGAPCEDLSGGLRPQPCIQLAAGGQRKRPEFGVVEASKPSKTEELGASNRVLSYCFW
jgi:protein-tyrosine phosphatase